MEIVIAGKKVVLKDRLKAREGWPLLKHLRDGLGTFNPEEYERWVDIARLYVQAWEFAGDPSDAASYEQLDLFEEFMPLVVRLMEQINPRAEGVKN